jgi:hypothetical protein
MLLLFALLLLAAPGDDLPEMIPLADLPTTGNRAAGERFYKELKLTLPAVYDEGSVALSQFDVETFPTTYVIDQTGTVVLRSAGYNKRYKLKPLIDFVNRLVRRQ